MAEYAPTPVLGLKRPISGTGQAWSTQKYITDNMDAIEDYASDSNIRLDRLEKYLRGTTAERNAFFGTPSIPADRVTLANKFARWYNTDKGYEEQYHAQWDDAGVAATTPVKKTHGWKPYLVGGGRIPISVFTPVTIADQRKYGNTIELQSSQVGFQVNNIFTSDFDEYELVIEALSSSGLTDIGFQFTAAGAVAPPSTYTRQRHIGASGTSSAEQSVSLNFMHLFTSSSTEGGYYYLRITNPASIDWKRFLGQGGHATHLQTLSAIMKTNTAYDGFRLACAAGTLGTGSTVRVFGISNGK